MFLEKRLFFYLSSWL